MPKSRIIKVKLSPNRPRGQSHRGTILPVKKSAPSYLKPKTAKS